MFYLDKEEDLTPSLLGKICRKFQSEQLPKLEKRRNYYLGNQEISNRILADISKPNNKIVRNYCSTIVDNYQGYLTGNAITYTGDADIQGILANNDIRNSDNEFLHNALIYGRAYQIVYINEKLEKKFTNVDSRNTFTVSSNTLDEETLYAVYFTPTYSWDEAKPLTYNVTVYSPTDIYTYTATNNFNSFKLEEVTPHYFGAVPVVTFNLNQDDEAIFEKIFTLQDAYNKLISDELNSFESFVDAYLVLHNITANAEDLAAMKASRTILLDGDAQAYYLTKDDNATATQQLLDEINTSIRTVANAPDFSSEEFGAGVSSGLALQFKLVGFNNTASNIEARMRKALETRIELFGNLLALMGSAVEEVEIIFNYNLPASLSENVDVVNALRGLVSDETLLAQLPFIENVGEELQRLAAQEDAELYLFPEVDDNNELLG